MTILLWGVPGESGLDAVRTELALLGVRAIMLDQHAVRDTAVELEVGSELRGAIRTAAWDLDLREVTAALLRPYHPRDLPAVAASGPGSTIWEHALGVHQALLSWAELAPARVVNRPGPSAANNSKPFQLELIPRHGFAVPETLVTTDPVAARRFWERHGTVVYKSVSGVRSVVARLTPADLPRLADVAFCPTQFQEYVCGVDVRVHVVGEEVIACEVASEADDYRYPGPHRVAIRPCALPEEIGDRCRAMAAAMGLELAGIDLRRSGERGWYCFEVNPSPAFTYFEQTMDLGSRTVRGAIARLLASAG